MSDDLTDVGSRRDRISRSWKYLPRPLRMTIALTVGGTLVAVGVALLVLPGPGLLVIALGLALLATEFAWARHLLTRGKHHATRAADAAKSALRKPQTPDPSTPSITAHNKEERP
jgi:uncharacterized protein (TIGR02611 family)